MVVVMVALGGRGASVVVLWRMFNELGSLWHTN
jgi:hypothetical protein